MWKDNRRWHVACSRYQVEVQGSRDHQACPSLMASDGESDIGSNDEASSAYSEDGSDKDSENDIGSDPPSICDGDSEVLACSEDGSDMDSENDSDEGTSSAEGTSSSSNGKSSGDEVETWAEHVGRFGEAHRCCRCRYRQNRAEWRAALTYETKDGERVSWLEEKCEEGHPWGLGCKLCRLFGTKYRWGNAEVRGERATRFNQLVMHGASNHTHQRAPAALL